MHHALHALLTGERQGYYVDFGALECLADVFQEVFWHAGTFSTFRGRTHGRPVDRERIPGHRFVAYLQNHDQIGNRAAGDRLSDTVDDRLLKVGVTLLFTGPFTPMLFMGEEWAAGTPWQFFTSHPEPDLARAVAEGRRAEFASHGWSTDVEVPDPQDPATFARSKLDWSELFQPRHRGMLDFCSVDPRLIPTLYVPLVDFAEAVAVTEEALAASEGACALLVASGCPKHHSPSHVALDPVWARAQEAGVPVVFHVGGTGDLLDAAYFQNGLPIPPDFHGGEENFRSVDYMGIPRPPMQTLATMIFDGVLERFPDLRVGVIEQGAIWLPSWMRQMESAFDAFARHEDRLQALSMRPSEYVKRQVRATPYPTEDVGWIIEQSGPEVCMFSSDYPHVEGGRRPLERFEASLGEASEGVRDAFYRSNFEDLMGPVIDRVPVPA